MTLLVVRPHHRYCIMDMKVISGSLKSEMLLVWGEQGAKKLYRYVNLLFYQDRLPKGEPEASEHNFGAHMFGEKG